MISRAFINGERSNYEEDMILSKFTTYTESVVSDYIDFCQSMITESYINNIDSLLDDSFVIEKKNETTDSSNKSTSIINKLGQAIINIFNKFVELIDRLIENIRSITLKGKTDTAKLEKMIKKHPEFAEELKDAFTAGELDLSAVSNLADLDKAYDDILKMAKRKNVDPDTLKGKWEQAKKKYLTTDNLIKSGSILSAVLIIRTFSSKSAEAKNKLQKNKQEMETFKAKTYKTLVDENIIDPSKDGIGTTILTMWRELSGHHARAAKDVSTRITKMSDRIAKIVDKLDSKYAGKGKEYHTDMDILLSRKKN